MRTPPVPQDWYVSEKSFTEKVQQRAVSWADLSMGVNGRDYAELVTFFTTL